MAFEEALESLSARVREYAPNLTTEEATKTAVVLPFIGQVLGYDVFDPREVHPEYVADLGMKKGEKVDYAIMKDGQVQILIEVKRIGDPLTLVHASQLIRYFHTSNARIGILTNGQHWHFYTDLDRTNVMDETPFLQLDLMDMDPYLLPELRKMTKETFDLDSVISAAEELKYVGGLKRELARHFERPGDDFVRLLAAPVYGGVFTQRVRDQFSRLTMKAVTQFFNEGVNDRLKSALNAPVPAMGVMSGSGVTVDEEEAADNPEDSGITTTMIEIEGFQIVRAIAASEAPYSRIVARDQKSYFSVLLDDNNRKPICRLHFNRKQMYLGLFDAERNEQRVPIERVEEIYDHAEEIRARVRAYLGIVTEDDIADPIPFLTGTRFAL